MNDSRNNSTETWPPWGTKAAQKDPFMKIAYIVGLGRSGSTLLDLMLNAHSQVCTVGEAKTLWSRAHVKKRMRWKPKGYYTHGSRCACGAETIWHCPFWTRVNNALEKISGLSLTDLDIESSDLETFKLHNSYFFRAVQMAGNAQVVVDSSKGLTRLKKLLKIQEAQVFPIYLHRNPKGRANSVRKNRNRVFSPTIQYSYNSFRLFLSLAFRYHVMLKYEDLVDSPHEELQRIMHFLDLHFENSQMDWARFDSHNLAGNSMNRTKDSTLKLDASWRTELSTMQKAIIELLALPGNAINSAHKRLHN